MSIRDVLDDVELRHAAKETLEYVKTVLLRAFQEKGIEAEIDLRIVISGGPLPKSVKVIANVSPSSPAEESPDGPEDDAAIRGRMIELE